MQIIGKKGYLRTAEAAIALVIVLIVAFYTIPREKIDTAAVPNIIDASQDIIKQKILLDEALKNAVINEDSNAKKLVGDIIEKDKPIGFIYVFRICDNPTCLCTASTTDCIAPSGKLPSDATANVYMADVFISAVSGGEEIKHKVIRFWIWQE